MKSLAFSLLEYIFQIVILISHFFKYRSILLHLGTIFMWERKAEKRVSQGLVMHKVERHFSKGQKVQLDPCWCWQTCGDQHSADGAIPVWYCAFKLHPPVGWYFGGSSAASVRFIHCCGIGAACVPAGPQSGWCKGTRGRAVRTEQKISLITWIYVWGFFFFFFLSLEASGLTEAGAASAASGMLKNNNKPVFSAAAGLLGLKFGILPQHCSPSSWKSSLAVELKEIKLFLLSSMGSVV